MAPADFFLSGLGWCQSGASFAGNEHRHRVWPSLWLPYAPSVHTLHAPAALGGLQSASAHRSGRCATILTEFDLAATLLFVSSVLDLASGLAPSLLVSLNLSFTFNLEIFMESNLFTVLEAVKFECASLWG